MALTAKQEAFARAVGVEGLNQTEAYTKAYGAGKMSPNALSSTAARLAALPPVAARIAVLIEGPTAEAVRKTGLTLADSINEAGEMLDGAKAAGQYSAGVAAAKLRAQLAGHLVERKEVRSGPLEDVDIARLLSMKAQAEADLSKASEVAEFMGDATVTVDQPVRRAIG